MGYEKQIIIAKSAAGGMRRKRQRKLRRWKIQQAVVDHAHEGRVAIFDSTGNAA